MNEATPVIMKRLGSRSTVCWLRLRKIRLPALTARSHIAKVVAMVSSLPVKATSNSLRIITWAVVLTNPRAKARGTSPFLEAIAELSSLI